jgi:glycosyltransferase involved in cell wall biosynthesis
MSKICVLGAFGFRVEHYDGQTIKTRNLLNLLKNKGTNPEFFETQNFKFNKLSVLSMCIKILRCKTLFYLPASNNLTYLFPIIYILSQLSRCKIHYFVVGGWLREFLDNKPLHRRMLSKISGIHCETELMKTLLENDYDFKNVDTFPNFRINNYKPTFHHEEGKLKLVFMARVNKKKGLDTIFSMCEKIKQNQLDNVVSIDFYGQLQNQDGDVDLFNTNIAKYDFVKYNGPVEPSNVYSVLEKYDAMLLPTHYFTEGLPGSVIDAYMSGIPVIVTKWKHATEFVEDEKTGLIIPFEDDGSALYEAILRLFNNVELLKNMKLFSLKKGYDFSSDRAWELLQRYLKD